jgi:CheY-like chemotaxis protein
VQADLTQLHQVLLNLSVNARDAMPYGGRLEIKLANLVLDEGYTAMNPEARPGPHVVIEVSDTGTGIPPEIRNKIFEPFFTTKPQGVGTGLGLSTAYAIVKGHGGFMTVYSEVGKGTQIKVYLPAEPKAEAGTPGVGIIDLPWGNGETVLIVDDEDSIGLLAQRTLERYGYKTQHARNGAEAIAIYATANPPVDVVLTDMAMPIMDGPSTIIALRKINPSVRIVGASGLGSNSKFAHALGAGLAHFLHKPYTAESLLMVLRRALEDSAPADEKT